MTGAETEISLVDIKETMQKDHAGISKLIACDLLTTSVTGQEIMMDHTAQYPAPVIHPS